MTATPNYFFLDGQKLVATDNGDGTKTLVVSSTGGGGGSSGPDRELVVSTYRCKTAFTGSSVGDTITATQVIDVSGATPTTISTIWRNQTTAADLASAPSAANLELVGSTALTDAQLRASAVPVSGPLTDTQLRASAVPVSGPLTQAQLTAAALATDAVLQAVRDRLPTALLGGRLQVEPLGVPGVARQQATTAASTNVALTVGVGRISLFARTSPLRYSVGSAAQTANAATSHYLAAGERIDIDVPATPNIAVIRAADASVDGAAEITELS